MTEKLKVTVTLCGAEQWIHFTGKLVHGTESCGKARSMLLGMAHKEHTRIILDLGDLECVDAVGVEAIALAAAAARATGGTTMEIWRMPNLIRHPLALILQVRLYTACAHTVDRADELSPIDAGGAVTLKGGALQTVSS